MPCATASPHHVCGKDSSPRNREGAVRIRMENASGVSVSLPKSGIWNWRRLARLLQRHVRPWHTQLPADCLPAAYRATAWGRVAQIDCASTVVYKMLPQCWCGLRIRRGRPCVAPGRGTGEGVLARNRVGCRCRALGDGVDQLGTDNAPLTPRTCRISKSNCFIDCPFWQPWEYWISGRI